jgi:hypothetical protein
MNDAIEILKQDIKEIGDTMMGKVQNSPESKQYAKLFSEAIERYITNKLTELELI